MKIPTSRRLLASYAAHIGWIVAYAAAIVLAVNHISQALQK